MSKSKPQIELKTFDLGEGDLVAVAALEDEPGRVAFICEKEVDGVLQRRVVTFPEDPALLSCLAQSLMRIADIQQISISKKKQESNVQFGPKYAAEMFRRTR